MEARSTSWSTADHPSPTWPGGRTGSRRSNGGAGGCHLNRPIDQLVAGSGLEVTKMESYYAKGPRAFGYMFEGLATKS